jgi:chromosome segregation ATPase
MLPEYLRKTQQLMDVLDAARIRRAEKSAQKQAAELRVRLGEEHMTTLRQELLEAERDLQDANDTVSTLQRSFMEAPSKIEANNPMSIPDDSEDSEDFHSEHFAPRG